MNFLERAGDFYAQSPVAPRLMPAAAAGLLFLALIVIGLHMIRRSFGIPQPDTPKDAPASNITYMRYELGARLYHWGNAFLFVSLAISGVALYLPGSIPYLGISWLLLHEVTAFLFILGLVLHIIFALLRGDPKSMWFERRDYRDLRHVLLYYLDGGQCIPRFGKYDVNQKIYHAILTLLSVLMIVTGISLFLNAEALVTLSRRWMGWQRLLHELGAISFILIGFAHFYVRLLRTNWPKFVSMVTGTIGAREYYEKHDPTRWPAPSVNATKPDKVVQTQAEPVQRKRLYGRRPSKAART